MTYKYFLGHDQQHTHNGLPNIYRHDGRGVYLLTVWGSWGLCSGTVEDVERMFTPITEKQVKSIIIKRELKK